MPKDLSEQVEAMSDAINRVSDSIRPHNSVPSTDASGNRVDSLTEAVIGITAGLFAMAKAIDNLADAVRVEE